MTLGAAARLVGHKAVRKLQRFYDEKIGWANISAQADAWARDWAAGQTELTPWLERDGGGRFWIGPRSGPRWARRTCCEADLRTARGILAGRFSLLGVEDAPIGNPPRWHRDLYSGRDWPLTRAATLPLVLAPGSDIRTLWELSRGYYFTALAKAFWRTGDPGYRDAFRGHVTSWLADNPPGLGPNWKSPMDAGIRAANWILAAQLFAEAGLPSEFWAGLLANLRVTGWFLERNLEWHPRFRGNHYVADAVGLVYLGACFRDDPAGARWLARGARLLASEMEYQVCPDGVSFEASLGYHRLVTELFSYGADLAVRNLPGPFGAGFWSRLERMHGFVAAYLPESADAPLLGDNDDGRLHVLSAESLEQPRRHRLGLRRRHFPGGRPASAAFPEGGFYVIRGAGGHAVIRCGPVGLRGGGSHDHNDQLSFELALGGAPFITDSGTFCYTRDLAERLRFRATAAHNVPQLGGEEQNPIALSRPWRVLADRTRARCTEWRSDGAGARFVGRHRGYAHRASGAECIRSINADFASRRWIIEDRIEGQGSEALTWRLHFAPGAVAARQLAPGSWRLTHATLPGVELALTAPAELRLELGSSPWSERYGVRRKRSLLELGGTVALPCTIRAEVTAG